MGLAEAVENHLHYVLDCADPQVPGVPCPAVLTGVPGLLVEYTDGVPVCYSDYVNPGKSVTPTPTTTLP